MAKIETEIISQSITKPREWKRYIDDIFSLWDTDKQEIILFIEQANNFHPTIKFTAEISENETFLDTYLKGSDSEMSPSLTFVHITNRLKHSSTHISPPATHQAWKEVLLKVKPWHFLEQILLRQRLKIISQVSNHA